MFFKRNIACLLCLLVACGYCDLQCKNNTSVLKLVIDHDGGADDAMAIFIALLYEKHFNGPKVVGIMTNHGNVDEYQAFINTQRILSVANRRDIPIFRGSNRSLIVDYPSDGFFGKDGLGETSFFSEFEPIIEDSEHASVALVRLSKEYEGDLILISLGGLTNLALAVMLDPNLFGRLEKITIGAGNINGKEFPDPEFNAMVDVEAYHIVVKRSRPDVVTVVPYSQTWLNITKDWRLSVLGAINTTIMRAMNAFEAFSLKNYASHLWVRLDPVAVAVTVDRSVVREAYCAHNDIIMCGDDRGINTNRFQVDCNVEMMKAADEEAYKKFLLDVFASEIFCNF